MQHTISSAQQLSPAEQVELIKVLFKKLLTQSPMNGNLVDTLLQLLGDAFRNANQSQKENLPQEKDQLSQPLRPLLGSWQGFQITDQDISDARQEMLGKLGEKEI